MRTLGRGLVRFLRIYAAYFLLITAIVAAGYGVEVGGVGTIAICLLIAVVLVYLAARVGGVRWPKR
ncbi:MAG TPA: hypothetical protein VF032_10365 [Thermoleophilaceae bacterium]